MDLNVLLWILGFILAGSCGWVLSIFCVSSPEMLARKMKNDVNQDIAEIRIQIIEIRREVSELHHCVKDHHGRLSVLEDRDRTGGWMVKK